MPVFDYRAEVRSEALFKSQEISCSALTVPPFLYFKWERKEDFKVIGPIRSSDRSHLQNITYFFLNSSELDYFQPRARALESFSPG